MHDHAHGSGIRGASNRRLLTISLCLTGVVFVVQVVGAILSGSLALLEQQGKSTDITKLSGMGFSQPMLGICLAIFALSAAGIPPTAGFLAKYFLFLEAVHAGNVFLVILAVLSALIGVYYYLRVVVYLYMKEGSERVALYNVNRLALIGIIACAFCILYFGFMPYKLGI